MPGEGIFLPPAFSAVKGKTFWPAEEKFGSGEKILLRRKRFSGEEKFWRREKILLRRKSFGGGRKVSAAGNVYNPLGGLRRHFAERILDYGKVLKRLSFGPVCGKNAEIR